MDRLCGESRLSADNRALGAGVCGRQSNRFTSVKGHIPHRATGSSGFSARRARSEVAQPAAASVSHTSSGAPLRSSPEVSTSAEAAPSSGTEITRRLLMEETRVLSRSDCYREVTSAPRDSLRFERGG